MTMKTRMSRFLLWTLSSAVSIQATLATSAFAQDGGAPAGGGGGKLPVWMAQPFLILSMLLIFYFLMIRPHQKRQKELQQMIGAMKQGDRVLTSGGLYGTIHSVKDDLVVLRIADNVKVEVAKSSITAVTATK